MTRLSDTLNRIRERHRNRSLLRRASRPAALWTVGLVAFGALALAGCGGGSSSGSSSTSSASQSSSFKSCLEKHGLTAPAGGKAGGGSGTPHARPTGSAASSFQQAMQACRGSSGSGPGSAG